MLTIRNIERLDITNNPGQDKPAVSLWFSGCSMKCPDCYNKLLWDKSAGLSYNVRTVIYAICSTFDKTGGDTLILIGGEPLEQDKADLKMLISTIHGYGFKVWLYTGWEFEDIPDDIKRCLDFIKCGRYDDSLKYDGFPSSTNQRIFRNVDDVWQQEIIREKGVS